MDSVKKSQSMERSTKATSKTANDTAKAPAPTLVDRSTMETGFKVRSTAKGRTHGPVAQSTPENSLMQLAQVRVCTNILTEQDMKGNGNPTKEMAKERTSGQKVTSMLVITSTENLKGKVLLPGPTAADTKASGKTALVAESASTPP